MKRQFLPLLFVFVVGCNPVTTPETTVENSSPNTTNNSQTSSNKPSPPSGNSTGHVDNFACNINSAGFCIFTGSPHSIDTSIQPAMVTDQDGKQVKVQGKPFQDGYKLTRTEMEITDSNEKGYIEVFKIMAPIRDALMYNIETLQEAGFTTLTSELTKLNIKTESQNLDSKIPKDKIYGTNDIFNLAKKPNGKDIHHEVMKYLEEAELELKCHKTTSDLTNPEGIDPCKEIRK